MILKFKPRRLQKGGTSCTFAVPVEWVESAGLQKYPRRDVVIFQEFHKLHRKNILTNSSKFSLQFHIKKNLQFSQDCRKYFLISNTQFIYWLQFYLNFHSKTHLKCKCLKNGFLPRF